MGFWEGVGGAMKAFGEYQQKEQARHDRIIVQKLRAASDDQVRGSIISAPYERTRELAREEAERRGIY